MKPDDTIWFEFIESKVFSKQVREFRSGVLVRIQSELVQNPERGVIVKAPTAFAKPGSQIPLPGVERVAVIDICISILNTSAEFTCYTCSAKENKLIYRRSKSKSSEC